MKKMLVAVFSLFAFMQANAALITLDGGVSGAVTANDVVGNTTFNLGGNIITTEALTTKVNVEFTYLGSEAGWNNDFDFGLLSGTAAGNTLFNNKTTAVGTVFSFDDIMIGELLNFGFYSNTSTGGVVNGANTVGLGLPSFATLLDYDLSGYGLFDAILGFDDSGAGPDSDYDDLVVGVRVSKVEVPEPATAALLGLGIAGIGASRLRRLRSASTDAHSA